MFSSISKNSAGGIETKATKRRGASFHESAVTIITPGCHFDGKLYCRGSSRIGGCVEGEIISEGVLIIEEEASITASIKADEVVIQGHVKGRLQAKDRVELAASSKFEGEIITPLLKIHEGAKFNGTTSMNSTQPQTAENIPIVGTLQNNKAAKKPIAVVADLGL